MIQWYLAESQSCTTVTTTDFRTYLSVLYLWALACQHPDPSSWQPRICPLWVRLLWALPRSALCLWVHLPWACLKGIAHWVALRAWLLSWAPCLPGLFMLLHVKSFPLFMADNTHCVVTARCVYASANGHSGCFHFWLLWMMLLWMLMLKFFFLTVVKQA